MIKKFINTIKNWFRKSPKPSPIRIMVGDKVIGIAQNIELLPPKDNQIQMVVARVRFDRAQVSKAFNRGFVYANAQKCPFQIEADQPDQPDQVVEISNAWITNNPRFITMDDSIIIDEIEMVCEDIKTIKPKKL